MRKLSNNKVIITRDVSWLNKSDKISKWIPTDKEDKQPTEPAHEIVFEKDSKKNEESSPDVEELYAQIGKLKVENEFLKKSCKKLGI